MRKPARSSRDKEYLYRVRVRKGESWEQHEVTATSLVEVSRLLKRKMEDIVYLTKVKMA